MAETVTEQRIRHGKVAASRPFRSWLTRALAAVAIAAVPSLLSAQTLPTGGSVAAGSATIGTPSNGTLNINQSTNQAIINWNTFSVGQSGTVNFNQPGASSATLNRVTSSTPSSIAGTINAPGTVLLVNPNGIAITKSGVVNTGSFVGSTLDIGNKDFLAGNYNFRGNGASAPVVNSGRINVSDGGFAALRGGRVTNEGVITARLGKVGLGSGERATLDISGDGFLSVAVPSNQKGNRALVTNSGRIRANGGTVVLTAATAANALRNAVNVPGSIQANSVGTRNGKIVIGAGAGGIVNVGGRVAANGGRRDNGGTVAVSGAQVNVRGRVTANGRSGGRVSVAASQQTTVSGRISAIGRAGQGGRIDIAGQDIRLTGATVNASGTTGGGLVRVGGTFQGGNADPSNPLYQSFIGRFGALPDIASAQTVTIDAGTRINVSATGVGDGGTAIVWSNERTQFAGEIRGTGGVSFGDGGYAEVSSPNLLGFTGSANLTASAGSTGTLLLDPKFIIIATGGPGALPEIWGTNAGLTVTIAPQTLTNAGANILLQATTDITVTNAIALNAGRTLTLNAGRSIYVNANITTSGAAFTATINDQNAPSNRDLGQAVFTMASGTSITTTGTAAGAVSITTGTFGGGGSTNIGDFTLGTITTTGGAGGVAGGAVTVTNSVGQVLSATGGGTITANATNRTSNGTGLAGGTINLTGTGGLSLGNISATGAAAFGGNRAGGSGGNVTISGATASVGAITTTGGTATGTGTGGAAGTISITANGTTPTLTLTGNLTALGGNGQTTGVGGTVTLTSAGSITQSSGGITATSLALAGGGSFTLNSSSNSITNVSGSVGSLSLTDSVALTVTASNLTSTGANGISLTDTAIGGITVTGTLSSSTVGPITLIADAVSLGGTVTASGQTVTIRPYNASTTIGLGSGAGTLSLTQTELNNITASTLTFGDTTAATGALTVGGAVSLATTGVTNLRLLTAGTITIASGGSVTGKSGSNLTLATGTSFTNNSGSGALVVSGGGRWLVYSQNPASDTRGGLAYDFKQYNAPYATAPAQASGNGFLYTLAPTITPSLTGTVSKIYDGTTTATLAVGNYQVSGAVDGDTVVLNNPTSGSYGTKNVGTGKTVSVSGLAIASAYSGSPTVPVYGYSLASTTASGSVGTIIAASLTISGLAANNKTYDATTAATLSSAGSLSGVIPGDTVTLGTGSVTAAFANKNVGTGKTVTASGYSLGGTDAGNYVLSNPTTTADIIAASLTATIADQSKVYGAGDPSLLGITVSLTGVVPGDTVSASLASLMRAAGETVGSYSISGGSLNALTGTSAGNYTATLSTAGNTLTITQAALTATLTNPSQSKVYGADDPSVSGIAISLAGVINTSVTNWMGNITAINDNGHVSASPTSLTRDVGENVGSYNITGGLLSLSGDRAGNYSSTFNVSGSPTLTISQAALSASIANQSKIYGANDPSLSGITVNLAGLINRSVSTWNGSVAINDSGLTSTASALTRNAGENVGSYAITAATFTTPSTNYSAPTLTGSPTLAISQAAVTVTEGVTANDKTYDSTTAAMLTFASPTLAGVVSRTVATWNGTTSINDSDKVSIDTGSSYTATFADKNVGMGIAVTVAGLGLSGSGAANYTLTQPTGLSAAITARPVVLTGRSRYDGTTDVPASILSITNNLDGGNLILSGTGLLADSSVGSWPLLSSGGVLVGLTLGGSAAANYTLSGASGMVNITPVNPMSPSLFTSPAPDFSKFGNSVLWSLDNLLTGDFASAPDVNDFINLDPWRKGCIRGRQIDFTGCR